MNAPVLSDDARTGSRNVFGWYMYDWANSAFATTVLAGLLPAYFAEAVVQGEQAVLFGWHFETASLWAYASAAAAAMAFVAAPVLGAIADYATARKRFLLTFAYAGSLLTCALFLCKGGDVGWTLGLFVLAQFSFVAANVFYDAFLPHIVPADQMDRVSGRGFAYGYIGGGLQFLIALVLVLMMEDKALAARIGIAMAGLWWAGFTLFTAYGLEEPRPGKPHPEPVRERLSLIGYGRIGIGRTLTTLRHVRRYRYLVVFLIAFMLYNDGIQTVIKMATIFGKQELHLETSDLMITLLVIQAVAMVGAVLFGRIAGWIGTKRAVMLALVLWSAIVIYACFMQTREEYFGLGVAVGLVLGGSQALSRSLYASMIPAEASAEFFGFYSVFAKFSAIWGVLFFGVITDVTGSSRNAIASLVVLFIGGLVLLCFVNEHEARRTRMGDG